MIGYLQFEIDNRIVCLNVNHIIGLHSTKNSNETFIEITSSGTDNDVNGYTVKYPIGVVLKAITKDKTVVILEDVSSQEHF